MGQRAQNRIQHFVEALSQILRKKTQDEVTILLEQGVLTAIASVRSGIGYMLWPVNFDHERSRFTEEIHLHLSLAAKRNRQFNVHPKLARRVSQGFKTAV